MQEVYIGILFLLIPSMIPSTVEHGHKGALDSYHVTSGHFFQLSCAGCSEGSDCVNWTRGGSPGPGLPLGVEVRNGSLWFLPAQHDHGGLYTCKARNDNESWENEFSVSVDPGPCPVPDENRSLTQGKNDYIPCKQDHVFILDRNARIRWFKNCRPVDVSEPVLRVPDVSQEADGVYTCMVDFSLEGHNYNASRSMRLSVTHAEVLQMPKVKYPRQEIITVEPGSSLQLTCSAWVGAGEDVEGIHGYWNIDGKHIDEFQQLRDSWDFVREGENVYLQSTLNISEVLVDFLGAELKCVVINPLGKDTGVLRLQPADHRFFYTGVSLPLVLPVVILVVVFGFLFKVDLVLVYRKLRPRVFRRMTTPDGKLFDAFVSYLHGDAMCSSRAMTFALHMLPEVLERQHGYTLYVRGRDDTPGEAMHDAVAQAMERSRRLIIVLSGSSISSVEQKSLWQQDYDQRMGLHQALVHSSLRVILVEADAHVDYSALPESLRYIHKKQGALRWKARPAGSPTAPPSGRFWKCLRYHMPSEPGESTLGTV
ncbi:interleukin-1 receptor type 1-like isoform X2 [Hypomesus transpacificus]|uniref:interleukin-1 receptor type 1-like isoform X2 n=1 Tax=Hypomesus transpacificus TaxID=137520 RepID=UPI001F078A90|nr:interleukin-1 receptor type 1-like isoform X2 [Hypomesus transpacificus]